MSEAWRITKAFVGEGKDTGDFAWRNPAIPRRGGTVIDAEG
jgi:hypothetical protein